MSYGGAPQSFAGHLESFGDRDWVQLSIDGSNGLPLSVIIENTAPVRLEVVLRDDSGALIAEDLDPFLENTALEDGVTDSVFLSLPVQEFTDAFTFSRQRATRSGWISGRPHPTALATIP